MCSDFSLNIWWYSLPGKLLSRSKDEGGCKKFVPVREGDGTKISPPGDIFDQPSGKKS